VDRFNVSSSAEADQSELLSENLTNRQKALAESLLALGPPVVPVSRRPLTSKHRSKQAPRMSLALDGDSDLKSAGNLPNRAKVQDEKISGAAVLTPWHGNLRRNGLIGLAAKIFVDVSSSFRYDFPIPRGAPQATGTLAGAISLVAGSTLGAGILALPAKTIDAGFGPSVLAILMCWIFFAATGLLIAEVNVKTLCALERNAVSFESMAKETLGEIGARLSGTVYVFIAYALLVAYMIQGGNILLQFLSPIFTPSMTLPSALGPVLFGVIAGGAIFAGSEQQVANGNSILLAGILATFAALLGLGLPQMDASLLMHSSMESIFPAIPVLMVALVFHNIIPTICHQLGCDLNKIRTAIIAGSGIPALMYIAWNLVILGSIPPQAGSVGSLFDPLESLRSSGDTFGTLVSAFSAFALLASFTGSLIGLVDYFADIFAKPLGIGSTCDASCKIEIHTNTEKCIDTASRYTTSQRCILFGSSLCPPLAIALYDPSLFFVALDNAGIFGNLLLFGIVPVAMVWQQRYGSKDKSSIGTDSELAVPPVLPGGRLTLTLMMSGAVGMFLFEGYERCAGAIGM
jgi:tyrosine-specific transport protein